MAFNTGNPVEPNGSTDPRDLKDNAAIIDKLVNSSDLDWLGRLGKTLKTWAGMTSEFIAAQLQRTNDFQAFLQSISFEVPVNYAAGISITRSTQTVLYNGQTYRPKPEALPFVTTTFPADATKWLLAGDSPLRQDLAAVNDLSLGASQVGGATRQINSLAVLKTYAGRYDGDQISLLGTVAIGLNGGPFYWSASSTATADDNTVVQVTGLSTGRWIRFSLSSAGLRTTGYGSIIAGDNPVTGPAVRDAFTAARNVVGETDCHDFASKTVISGVTDYGGFGTFDATTTLIGSNNQDHMFDFQARNKYSGSGSINYFAGMILRPEHNGTGVINNRFGIDLTGTVITAGGTILEETGIRIRELVGANANVGLRTDQRIVAGKVSYNIYSPATAPSYHNGSVAIGVDTNATAKFTVTHGLGTQTGFMDSTSDTVQIGSVGDSYFGVYTNAGLRLELRNSAEGYTFRPGTTNTQYNGDASKYWKGGYIGTAWQVVSDGTKKTPVRSLVDAEIKTAQELADEIGIWQFLDSVAEKGDDVARLHVSMTVQKAIEVFERNGLDARRYGFICLDTWPDEYVDHPAEVVEHPEVIKVSSITDGNGQPYKTVESEAWTETLKPAWTEKVREAGQLYSFRESGILWFIMAGLNASIKSCCPSDSQHPTS